MGELEARSGSAYCAGIPASKVAKTRSRKDKKGKNEAPFKKDKDWHRARDLARRDRERAGKGKPNNLPDHPSTYRYRSGDSSSGGSSSASEISRARSDRSRQDLVDVGEPEQQVMSDYAAALGGAEEK
jgi:hypothetical protein